MTALLILVIFSVVLWALAKDQIALARDANRVMAQAQRRPRPENMDIRALLEEAGRLSPRDSAAARGASEMPWIPPYESADPLWDRELDQRGA